MNRNISFFKDEIRNGFYIPTAIKQVWACSLDVLSEIDRICQKHSITYFADWGSILAAARHGGFVPWDDDIDICMKRDDYEKFRSVADNELPTNYTIHDYERQENHWLFLSRVVGGKRISFNEDYLNEHYNFPWLSAVDIFVKDYLYKDPVKEKKRCDEVLYIITTADMLTEKKYSSRSQLDHTLSMIEEQYSVSFKNCKDDRAISVALYKLAERQMARVPKDSSDSIGQIFPWIIKGRPGEPKEYYENPIYLPFEDIQIPVPNHYNKVLTDRYGNYCEIHKVWTGHDYPAFESQKKVFEINSGIKCPHFAFNKTLLNRAITDKSQSLKTICKECILALNQQYNYCCNLVNTMNYSDLNLQFSEMQNLVVDLGTAIEQVKGENSPHTKSVISILEQFNDTIYFTYKKILDDKIFTLDEIRCNLNKLEKIISKEIIDRNEILFLPVGPIEWSVFETLYNDAVKEPNTDVFVVPLPLMYKDYLGNVKMDKAKIDESLQLNEYPDNILLCQWENFNLSLHCPETIYFQNPYDDTNPCLTIPGLYYSSNLQKYTDKLIYIPIGATAEFTETDYTDQANLKYYVNTPGLFYADKIIVQSENIKRQYISSLCEFSDYSYKEFFEAKIDYNEKLFNTFSSTSHNHKKELLYCISIYEPIENKDVISDKIIEKMLIFKENADKLDVSLCVYPNDSKLRSFVTSLADKIDLKYTFAPFDKKNITYFAHHYDAYYGSSSPLVPEFINSKKPIMISNYEI